MRYLTVIATTLVLPCLLTAIPAFAAKAPLVMAYSEDAPPVSWMENGTPRGIFVDVVDEIVGTRLGIPVEHLVLPWARAQQLVKIGDADGLVTVASEKRKSFANVSAVPVQTHRNRIVIRANHPDIQEIKHIANVDGLAKYRIGVHLGNGWAKEHLKGFDVIEAPSIDLLLKMLVAERIDVVIQGDAVTLYYRKQLGYVDELVVLPNSFDSLDFRFMVNKNSTYSDLPEAFDRELKKIMDDGTLEELFARYR